MKGARGKKCVNHIEEKLMTNKTTVIKADKGKSITVMKENK